MDISCKRCQSVIAADGINLEKLIAKCAECNAVFGFSEQIQSVSDEAGEPKRQRDPVPLPESFKLYRDRQEVNSGAGGAGPYRQAQRPPRENVAVEWRWFKPLFIFLLLFTIAWDAFLLFWYFGAPSGGGLFHNIFPLAHVAVGVGLTYYVACGFVNRTRVAVEGDELIVDHSPLPWRGNRRIRAADLDQFYCVENISYGKNNTPTRSYALHAVDRSGKDLKLLTLDRPAQALYLEQLLEQHLGIEDVEVPGEMRSR